MYGIYEFKKGFGGRVVELIGEFDLIISKPKYNLYNFMLKIYNKLKIKGLIYNIIPLFFFLLFY